MEINIIGRDGALTKFQIVGGKALEDADWPSTARVIDNDMIVSCSKADLRRWEVLVQQHNSINERKSTKSNAGAKRIVVEAGTVKIGDVLPQGIVTGLGRQWIPNADTFSKNGISPAASFVQYAYFD